MSQDLIIYFWCVSNLLVYYTNKCLYCYSDISYAWNKVVTLPDLKQATIHRIKSQELWKIYMPNMHELQTSTVYLFFTVISFFLFLSVSQALDGRIYEHVKDYLVALCHNELEASQATHNTFQFLLDKSTRVSPMWWDLSLCSFSGTPWHF